MTKGRALGMKSLWQRGLLSAILLTILGFFIASIDCFPESIEHKSGTDQHPVTPGVTPALKDRVFLVMKAEKVQAYIHEIVPLTIQLFSHGVTLKDIQYPQLSHEDFSIQEFENPVQGTETINGILFEILEFKTNIFGEKTGDFRLGPAQLQCTLLIGKEGGISPPSGGRTAVDTYFGSSENYLLNLESEKIPLEVIPLPGKGKPVDFRGAVGLFNFSMEVHPREVKVGDPITLKMKIEGNGNFNTVTPPVIEKGTVFKTYEPQVKQQEGLKIYEQILIPQSETVKEIPRIRFSFFDPEKERYRTLHKGPLPIIVKKPDKEEGPKIGEASGSIGRNLIYIKESPSRLRKKGDLLHKNRTFLIFQLLPLLLFISLLIINKKRERLRTDLRYARRLEARKRAKRGIQKVEKILKKGKPVEFYDSLFKTIQEYLGNRFCLPSPGITGEVVDDVLKSKGLDEDILKKLSDIFVECDQARYAASLFGRTEMENIFYQMKEVINYLEGQQ